MAQVALVLQIGSPPRSRQVGVIRGGQDFLTVKVATAAHFLTLRLFLIGSTHVGCDDSGGPGHSPWYLDVNHSSMIILSITVIGCLILLYYAVYGIWERRKSLQYVNEYFSSHSKTNTPETETEQRIIALIDDNFFSGKRRGQIKPDMKVVDLYELVAGKYMDDMEIETLVMDLETIWNYKLPLTYQFSGITISELARNIDSHKASAANHSETRSA